LRIRHLTAVAALLAIVSNIGPSAAVAPIGKTVQATSIVRASGAAGPRVLKSATPVYFSDRLQSNATGVGQFQFVDGSKLAIGPNASIVIDKFVYKGGQTIQRLGIEAAKGAFRFISGKSASSAYQIVTPAGTMGIRGTAFDFTVRSGKAYVVLLQGNLRFCSGRACKDLKRSCDFIVAGGGSVSNPEHLSKGISGADARQIFPLLANQGRLSPSFRRAGQSCLTRLVLKGLERRERSLASPAGFTAPPASTPTPPAAASRRPNNGFGNGPEGREGGPDASNPGKGRGGPHALQ
jgi:hypothetical protein